MRGWVQLCSPTFATPPVVTAAPTSVGQPPVPQQFTAVRWAGTLGKGPCDGEVLAYGATHTEGISKKKTKQNKQTKNLTEEIGMQQYNAKQKESPLPPMSPKVRVGTRCAG